MIGDALWSMGDGPRRVLDALARDGTRADGLLDEAAPAELIANAAIDELTAAIELLPVATALAGARAADDGPAAGQSLTARRARAAAAVEARSSQGGAPAATPVASASTIGARSSPTAEADGRGEASARGAARSWLAAKAARAGAGAVLERPIAIAAAPVATVPVSAAAPVDASLARSNERTAAPPSSPAADRLTQVLDRLATAPAAASRVTARSARSAESARRSLADAAHVDDPSANRAAWLEEPALVAGARERWPARSAVDDVTTRAPDARDLRDARDARPPASSITAPAASRAAPGEPALAEAPLTGLRRFAMMAEASGPPTPGQVESTTPMGPRGPATSPPAALPLDDLELSERLNALLRREARRDGIDLEPPP